MNTSLSLLNVPLELINQLESINDNDCFKPDSQSRKETDERTKKLQIQENIKLTCRTCNLEIDSREEQKNHYSTEWHRYNIKRKIVLNLQPVTFEEFEELLSDLTETTSESFDVEDDREYDMINEIVFKQLEENEFVQNDTVEKPLVAKELQKFSSMSWFKHKKNPKLHYGIYRHILDCTSLAQLQNKSAQRFWSIFMLGGGHFAGCVIDVNESVSNIKLIEHKTIHRYTTRRKQGGSQSANDNSRGKANSAGAQIRRYNEQLLQQEVRQIVAQWKEKIQSSEFVFIHAPSGNHNILFGYKDSVFVAENTKTIPFATKRPTLDELKRVFVELTTIKRIVVNEKANEETCKRLEIEEIKGKQKSVEKTAKNIVELPTKIAPRNLELEKLLVLVKQKKTSVILNYIKNHKDLPLSGLLPKYLEEDLRHYPTLLHMISSLGQSGELISELLLKYDADPTIISDAGKTAYEVSKDKQTRNAFRRCMSELPNKWSWFEKARVPSPLTRKQEEEQKEKERQKEMREQEKKKLLDLERINQATKVSKDERHEETINSDVISSSLKSSGSNGILKDGMNHMSPESLLQFQREMRAKAAEERIKKLSK